MRVSKHLSNSVQLLAMAAGDFPSDHALLVCPPDPGLSRVFSTLWPEVKRLHHDFSVHRKDLADAETGPESEIGSFFQQDCPALDIPPSPVVIFLPKEKARLEYLLASAGERVPDRGEVLVVGPKRGGIRSAKKVVEAFIGPVTGSHSARHCSLWVSRKSRSTPPRPEGRTFSIEVKGLPLHVVTLPGVFSYGELDPGTALLLEQLSRYRASRVLDWGCGSGVIGAAMLRHLPDARVDFVDNDVMALAATARTLASNDLEAGSIHPADGPTGVEGRYDLIVSNPPFHAGLRTDYGQTKEMITASPLHLTKEGRLLMVLNTFINHRPLLEGAFREVHTVSETSRYRVVEAARPLAPGPAVIRR